MARDEISPGGEQQHPGGVGFVAADSPIDGRETSGAVLDAQQGERVRIAWAKRNARSSASYGGMVEEYPAGDWENGATLAQRLHSEGLIYRINREVLHPLGLALGVNVRSETFDAERVTGEVVGLTLSATDEPIEYTPEQIERNEAKLRQHGQRP